MQFSRYTAVLKRHLILAVEEFMLLRFFKPNMLKSAFTMRPASCFDVVRSFSRACYFFPLVGKHIGGGGLIQCSLPSVLGVVNSVRQFHKLRIANLPENATEEVIRDYFSRFGMILSAEVVRDAKTLESKGRGFVIFADKKALDTCMSYQPLVINNQTVILLPVREISFAVFGLSPSTSKESLSAYFSRYGKVCGCDIKHNLLKGSRDGFVNYHSESNVDLESASKVHVIDGKQVEVKRVFPKELTQYVGNLSPSTTDESLAAYYSQFGSLLQARVVKNRWDGGSRGFGYVTFSSQQEFDNALRSMPHIIDGREVTLGYATKEFTLFVAELPPSTTEQSLKQYFEQFAAVYECKIASDQQTNQQLCHGWVTFSSQQGLNDVIAAGPHVIDGKRIDVNRSEEKLGKTRILFVGGLSPKTTHEMLYDVFSKFGSLVSCDVKYDRMSGKARGFGYVIYSTLDEASKALLACPHVVDGRVVGVAPYKEFSKGESKSMENQL